jgi:hypothetical protein
MVTCIFSFYTIVAPPSIKANSQYQLSVATTNLDGPMQFSFQIICKVDEVFAQQKVTLTANENKIITFDVSFVVYFPFLK